MMPIDGIINGTNGIINQNRGEESMNAVIYARYSSDSQREESIKGQIRECTEYAMRNGITILGTYIDRALSARSADRPEFQRMMQAVRYSYVIPCSQAALKHLIQYERGIINEMRAWALLIEFFASLLRVTAAFRIKAGQRQQLTAIDARIFPFKPVRKFSDQRIVPLLCVVIGRIIVAFHDTKHQRGGAHHTAGFAQASQSASER